MDRAALSDPAAYYLQPLSWHQVSARPEAYELRAIPGPVGSLVFDRRDVGIARTTALAWRFSRRGIFRRVAEVSLAGGALLATCRLGFWSGRGTLVEGGGLTLLFGASRWDKSYSVRTSRGGVVLSYDFRGFFSLRAPLTWGDDPGPAETLPWLPYFTWYLAVRHYREVIEAAAAVVVSG